MSSAPSSMNAMDAYLDAEERESQKIRTDNLGQLIHYILRHRGALVGGAALIGVGTFAALLEPRLFGYAIDEAIVPGKLEFLRGLSIIYLLIISVRAAAVIGHAYLFELLGQRVTQDLRCELFAHLQRLPISVYDKNPAGRLLTRVTNDIASLQEMFSAGFVSMIGNLLTVLGILIWLLILDLKLGLIAAAILPILTVASVHFSGKLRIAYREARSKLSALNAYLAENLLGMKVVHLFNRQKLHLERLDRISQWYTDAQFSSTRVFALFQPTITWCSGIAMALVIWYGGKSTVEGSLKLGVLVAFFSYVLSLFQPMREIADKWNIFLSGMASAERVFSILAWPIETEAAAPKKLDAIRGEIVFENVWFAYDQENWVLKDFNVRIPAGSRIGVVGHTGAGKTTLISLLIRFYEPQRGRILIDGQDIREVGKAELRQRIGIIQQDVFLFSGSFRDNITFWGSQARPDLMPVQVALTQMGYGKWWGETGRGPVTPLGESASGSEELLERGGNLSMGERQVLAFARALASDPGIWILDEATANMDSGSEELLQQSLDTAARGKTSILIAHRLATVRSADRILVLHKGVLVEQGRHEELVRTDGLYARLYRFQCAQEAQTVNSTKT